MTTRTIDCAECGASVPYGRLSCPRCGSLLASVTGRTAVQLVEVQSAAGSRFRTRSAPARPLWGACLDDAEPPARAVDPLDESRGTRPDPGRGTRPAGRRRRRRMPVAGRNAGCQSNLRPRPTRPSSLWRPVRSPTAAAAQRGPHHAAVPGRSCSGRASAGGGGPTPRPRPAPIETAIGTAGRAATSAPHPRRPLVRGPARRPLPPIPGRQQ